MTQTQTEYTEIVNRLSKASVVKKYDAYLDVDWDAPESQIDLRDPRLRLSSTDPLGATSWYQGLDPDTQSRLGLHMLINRTRNGLQFESLLKRGLLMFAETLPPGAPEFRYIYHEIIEEAQHSLMFNELILRSTLPVHGLEGALKFVMNRALATSHALPEMFFIYVLGGEEPIDYVQKQDLKRKDQIHPLIARIMQIHVTEEARHIKFAQSYLEKHVPGLSRTRKLLLQGLTPYIINSMVTVAMQPPPHIIESYGIPESVLEEAYQGDRYHQIRVESLRGFTKVCTNLGILTPRTLPLWKRLRIA